MSNVEPLVEKAMRVRQAQRWTRRRRKPRRAESAALPFSRLTISDVLPSLRQIANTHTLTHQLGCFFSASNCARPAAALRDKCPACPERRTLEELLHERDDNDDSVERAGRIQPISVTRLDAARKTTNEEMRKKKIVPFPFALLSSSDKLDGTTEIR